MAKLTLNIDERVISEAKQYARLRGTSVSKLVETYLAALTSARPSLVENAAPVLQSVRGILKKGNLSDHREHLAQKHR